MKFHVWKSLEEACVKSNQPAAEKYRKRRGRTGKARWIYHGRGGSQCEISSSLDSI